MREPRARQLVFPLDRPARLGREDLIEGLSNRAALDLIDRWPTWPAPGVVIVGPPGSGKTHLATIWKSKAGAALISAEAITAEDPLALAGTPLVIEGIDAPGVDERALFHVLNAARQRGVAVLMTSAVPPSALGLHLPDLASRLRAALRIDLGPPDDALLEHLLLKLFADRQIAVEAEVARFLALRMERSFDAARRLVELLDREALATGRPVTRALAARLIGHEGGGEPLLPGFEE